MATDHPWCKSPSMAERGMRASVKNSSAKVCPPVIVVSGRASMPGVEYLDQETADPRVLLRGRVGPHVELAPIRQVAQGVPGLLPVNDEVVAVFDRGGAERGEVRTGVGLGHALRPDLVAAQHGLEEALLFLRGAKVHDCRRDVGDADHVHRAGRAQAVHLLHEGELLRRRRQHALRLDRPRGSGPAAVGQVRFQARSGSRLRSTGADPPRRLGGEVASSTSGAPRGTGPRQVRATSCSHSNSPSGNCSVYP